MHSDVYIFEFFIVVMCVMGYDNFVGWWVGTSVQRNIQPAFSWLSFLNYEDGCIMLL
jgi:hypothetical protein